jgi:ApaG protein
MNFYNGNVVTAIAELTGLRVHLDRLEYSPDLSGTPTHPYAFSYHITIDNQSDRIVVIKGRKWVLTDDTGRVMAYEGDGIVGEFPRLTPGESFHYNSYHLISHNCAAEGAYIGIDANNVPVLTRIPRFLMVIPPRLPA